MKKRCVGIHYSGGSLTAVVVGKDGEAVDVGSPLKLTVGGDGPGVLEGLLGQLSERLGEGGSRRPAVVLTLGGRWYQTQYHHSEFEDMRQLRQTLRFDVEEDLAGSAEETALCFEPASTEPSGADAVGAGQGVDLLVHTCERRALEEILDQFERSGWDALAAEPDVTAWMHYLSAQGERGSGAVAAGAWVSQTLYTLVLDEAGRPVVARTCVCSSGSEAAAMLGQELKRSLALLGEDAQPKRLLMHMDGFSGGALGQLQQATGLTCEALAESDASTAFATGAALGYLGEGTKADFRSDGLEARTLVRERRWAWAAFSAALSVLLAAVLVVVLAYGHGYKQAESDADVRMKEAYSKIFDKEPTSMSSIPRIMRNHLRTLKLQDRSTARQMVPGSASHTMMLVFETLDTLDEDFDLQIDRLRVQAEVATLTGSVRGLIEKAQMQAVVRANPNLELEAWNIDRPGTGESPRRNFTMSLQVVSGREADSERSRSR